MLWSWTFRINCQAKIQDDFLCCYKNEAEIINLSQHILILPNKKYFIMIFILYSLSIIKKVHLSRTGSFWVLICVLIDYLLWITLFFAYFLNVDSFLNSICSMLELDLFCQIFRFNFSIHNPFKSKWLIPGTY